ncbi:3-oxoacyl-[acyl-carrier-protein] reductase FabG [Stieleria neptunia]|uniref:3-oxoacyl-[acyl-carrier-protein] reductase FabG n=1 Tax=Stieleria neptunia TaxID=2527979 RepID=A0A518I1S4_9BACT|nr:SDR family oxidoreductase [Stieleria neptunia]QDV47028.1 3-oxoacyl-[acyl-carrier-protein] reductase FabG [Stieleria neptunia]
MSIDVRNQTVLITGANRGIGKVILETAIEQGAEKVYAAVRNVDSVAGLVDKHGDKVVPIVIDLQLPQTIADAASVATDVTIVINNAGIARTNDLLSPQAFSDYEAEHKTNVLGLLHLAQAFAPVLKSNGGGALVQLNSVVSIKSFVDFATYSASKAASYSLTQALREKLALQQTSVVSVHPGPIKTEMAEAVGLADVAESPALVAEAIFAALRDDQFHVFPDSMAKQFEAAYAGFAKAFVEAELSEQA